MCEAARARGRLLPTLPQALEELGVGARQTQPVEERFHGLSGLATGEGPTQELDALELVLPEQQLLASRARAHHVERAEHAAIGELALEVELHVAGALEFLEDDLVHSRAGVHEGGTDDRERPTLLDLARRPEER